jgi:tetratricopeptide (TPR) repeat protein
MKTLRFVAFCLLIHPVPPSAVMAETSPDIAAMWNDPSFQKAFVGSYGINAEIEPRVTPEEVKILEKLRPLMADDKEQPKAEASLKKQIKPTSSAILDFTLASLQFQQEKFTEALESYQSAVTKFPSFRRAHRNIGLIQVHEGKYDEAIKAFTRMIELGGGDAYSYGLLGFAYASKLDFQPAEIAYRNALLLQPDNLEWRLGLTKCVFKEEKFEDAATLLNELIERYPEKADFWLLQAHAFLGMKQPIKAAQNLEALDVIGKSTVDSLHTLGDIYLSENLMDLASNAYRRGIDIDSKQPHSRPLKAAEVLAARGALTQAGEVVARVRQAWDAELEGAERSRVLKLEARIGMASGESTAETAAVLEEAVKLDPLDGEALMMLGQHCSRHNNPEQAIFYYERAANIEKFEVNAKLRHAQILVGMNRFEDAIPLLRRVQELKPRQDIASYLERIEGLAKAARR